MEEHHLAEDHQSGNDVLSRTLSAHDANERLPSQDVQEAVKDIEKHVNCFPGIDAELKGQPAEQVSEHVSEKNRGRMTSITRLGSQNPGYFDSNTKKTPFNTFFTPIDVNECLPKRREC
jgi:hypothetical protein